MMQQQEPSEVWRRIKPFVVRAIEDLGGASGIVLGTGNYSALTLVGNELTLHQSTLDTRYYHGACTTGRIPQIGASTTLADTYLASSVSGGVATITGAINAGGRTYTLPDASGTFALGSGVANQVGYWTGTNAMGGRTSFTDDGTTVAITRDSATALVVETALGTDALTVDTVNTYVGVCTSVPQKVLHVSNPGGAGQRATIRLSDTAAATDTQVICWLEYYRGNNTKRVGFFGFGSASTLDFSVWNEVGGMEFGTNQTFAAGRVQNMYIDPNGLVGINTGLTPATRFHVIHTTTTTNAVLEVARIEARVSTGGTGFAAGGGAGIALYAESATNGVYLQQAIISGEWVVPTNGAQTAIVRINPFDTSVRIGLALYANGTTCLAGVGVATPLYKWHVDNSTTSGIIGWFTATANGGVAEVGVNNQYSAASSTDETARFGLYQAGVLAGALTGIREEDFTADANNSGGVAIGVINNNSFANHVYLAASGMLGAGFASVTGIAAQVHAKAEAVDRVGIIAEAYSSSQTANLYENQISASVTSGWGCAGALFLGEPEEIEISCGVATSGKYRDRAKIDTESGAASDDLDTLTFANVQDGQILVLQAYDDSRTVVVKNGTGNIILSGSDFSLDNVYDRLTLMYDSDQAKWFELARANNG